MVKLLQNPHEYWAFTTVCLYLYTIRNYLFLFLFYHVYFLIFLFILTCSTLIVKCFLFLYISVVILHFLKIIKYIKMGISLSKDIPILLERMMRIELTQSAWKAEVLPLNYIRISATESIISRLRSKVKC